jgi:uncharacterized transporter YbjL
VIFTTGLSVGASHFEENFKEFTKNGKGKIIIFAILILIAIITIAVSRIFVL